MSIMIREYLGYDKFDVEHNYKEKKNLKENFVNYEDPIIPESLMVDIEGIHVGPTRNFTRYMEKALKSSEKSWTHPYNKPLIMHHNEKDGKIIGRIHAVKYTDVNTRSGTGALIFTSNVPDKDGMEQIEDGRLMTTSIGIIGHDVRCSICNTNIAEEGECEHERGQVYNGETCYWDIYEMEGKELSYVIVPSDIYAKNIKVYKPSALKKHLKENEETHKGKKNITEGDDGMTGKATKTEGNDNQEFLDLQESYAKLEAEKKALETQIAEKNDSVEITELKDGNIKLSDEIKESKETIEKLEKEVSELKESLEAKESEVKEVSKNLTEEKELREALENKSIELKESSKQALIENYIFLKKVSGKSEVNMDSIKERSLESIMDSVKDIKEELGDKLDFSTISLVSDPTLTEEREKDTKGKKETGNIDLQEGLESLFSDIAMIHKK